LSEEVANFVIAYRTTTSSSGGGGQQPGGSSGGGGQQPGGSSGGGQQPGGSPGGGQQPGGSSGGGGQQPGGSSGGGQQPGGSSGGGSSGKISRGSLDFNSQRSRSISSLFELVGAEVEMPGPTPESPKVRYPSPLNDATTRRQMLPILLDKFTTSRSQELPGLININTAPYAVLAGLPGLQDSDVSTIVGQRPRPADAASADPVYQTPAWLVTEAGLDAKKVQAIDRYITARTQVYRVQAVGYFDRGGPAARVEAVIDLNQGYPRVLYRRDLSELGKGFDTRGSSTP
jgi:hypothetical protein